MTGSQSYVLLNQDIWSSMLAILGCKLPITKVISHLQPLHQPWQGIPLPFLSQIGKSLQWQFTLPGESLNMGHILVTSRHRNDFVPSSLATLLRLPAPIPSPINPGIRSKTPTHRVPPGLSPPPQTNSPPSTLTVVFLFLPRLAFPLSLNFD